MTHKVDIPYGDVLTLRIYQSASLLRPWWGTMTHGTGHVGEAGGGVWQARSRPRLIRKMAKAAATFGFERADRVLIEVEDA